MKIILAAALIATLPTSAAAQFATDQVACKNFADRIEKVDGIYYDAEHARLVGWEWWCDDVTVKGELAVAMCEGAGDGHPLSRGTFRIHRDVTNDTVTITFSNGDVVELRRCE